MKACCKNLKRIDIALRVGYPHVYSVTCAGEHTNTSGAPKSPRLVSRYTESVQKHNGIARVLYDQDETSNCVRLESDPIFEQQRLCSPRRREPCF
ncbi:MAG: hypothetical protein HY319_02825 [Armatimonadetes bacterium]|nr:hypothetical protein [Armatimonadota bacterium]